MKENFQKIFNRLKKDKYRVVGPKEQDGELCVLELGEMPEAGLLGKITDRPWKYFLMPTREVLLEYKKSPAVPKLNFVKTVLFGMNILDLKALELYDRIFKNDFYYQQNRKNLFIIGVSDGPLKELKTDFFETDKILENVVFDIFIEIAKTSINYYAGSKAGAKFLKKCGLKFKKISYSPRKEDPTSLKLRGVDLKIVSLKKAVENSAENKLWDELGKICLACGKCTIACPTCFCFDFESTIGPEKKLQRTGGNCFYDDFSRIAGPPAKAGEPSGHKFLNNPKEKIFFWYFHKFVRNVRDYNLPGCVGCDRCTKVCPVGIDIRKNIQSLLKG